MPLAIPRQTIDKYSKITDLDEYRKMIFEQVRPDDIDIYLNRILCAVYLTHEKTRGGIILPTDQKAEDIWQGKLALVLKVGPTAFVDGSDFTFGGMTVSPGDWITFKVGNASQIEIHQYPCRIVSDHYIESRVVDPRMITS